MAQLRYGDAVGRAVAQETRRDPRVTLAGADLAEAVRVARTGMRPVVDVTFPALLAVRPADLDAPMVLRCAGCSKALGACLGVPGLKVVAPSSPGDAVGLFAAAVRDPGAVVFCEHEALLEVCAEVPDGEIVDRLGRARVLRRGDDATILALSATVPVALAVADRMERVGVDLTVVDLRSLVPLDITTLFQEVAHTGRVFTLEERRVAGGWAAEVVSVLADEGFWDLDGPVVRLGAGSGQQIIENIEKALQS